MQLILTENAVNLSAQMKDELNQYVSFTPDRATDGSAGYDIRACIASPMRLLPGQTLMIPLGFHAFIEDQNLAALVLPKSGLGANEGIVLGNLVGLIDSDYQNEWMCAVWNRNTNPRAIYTIYPGQKLAQILFVPVVLPNFTLVDKFTKATERLGGFGSTDRVDDYVVWPDETAALKSDLAEFGHKSDDYVVVKAMSEEEAIKNAKQIYAEAFKKAQTASGSTPAAPATSKPKDK